MRYAKTGLPCLCALIGVAWSGMVSAQDPAVAGVPAARPPLVRIAPAESWLAVGDRRLDAARGGFDSGNGLLVSFGIARQIYVNGNLVSSSNVQIPDVGHITSSQADALALATGTVNVIQIGPGNSFDPSAFRQATGATVIQNTLDNQNIQSLTTLDASVNNLNLFRGLNLQDSLQTGLINSRGQ